MSAIETGSSNCLTPKSVSTPAPNAFGTDCVERRRIARAIAFRHDGDVDPGHGSPAKVSVIALPVEICGPSRALDRRCFERENAIGAAAIDNDRKIAG
jgi:hypothetical protein